MKKGSWVVLTLLEAGKLGEVPVNAVELGIVVELNRELVRLGPGGVREVTGIDARPQLHLIDPATGETRMYFDPIQNRELTAAVIVDADMIRPARNDEIPVSRRAPVPAKEG